MRSCERTPKPSQPLQDTVPVAVTWPRGLGGYVVRGSRTDRHRRVFGYR